MINDLYTRKGATSYQFAKQLLLSRELDTKIGMLNAIDERLKLCNSLRAEDRHFYSEAREFLMCLRDFVSGGTAQERAEAEDAAVKEICAQKYADLDHLIVFAIRTVRTYFAAKAASNLAVLNAIRASDMDALMRMSWEQAFGLLGIRKIYQTV